MAFATSIPPTSVSLGDHWLFLLGRAGGVCPADAHPHPDPRISSQPAHGVQSTLQSEPQTVSTHRWGESGIVRIQQGGAGALEPQPPPGAFLPILFQQVPDQIAEAA